MKKLVLLFLSAVLLASVSKAQVPDTVQWKYRNYHYSPWYDTLPEFYDTAVVCSHDTWDEYGPALMLGWQMSEASFNRIRVMPQHVERPTYVYGAAVAVPMSPDTTVTVTVTAGA